jgi:hypothetical protein
LGTDTAGSGVNHVGTLNSRRGFLGTVLRT